MSDFQYTQTVVGPSVSISAGNTYSDSLSESFNGTAAANATTQVDLTAKVANVKGFAIFSDVDIALKTNSSGSPANTINIKAGIPYVWTTDSYDTFKLTTDVTTIFLVNATANIANVKIVSVAAAH